MPVKHRLFGLLVMLQVSMHVGLLPRGMVMTLLWVMTMSRLGVCAARSHQQYCQGARACRPFECSHEMLPLFSRIGGPLTPTALSSSATIRGDFRLHPLGKRILHEAAGCIAKGSRS